MFCSWWGNYEFLCLNGSHVVIYTCMYVCMYICNAVVAASNKLLWAAINAASSTAWQLEDIRALKASGSSMRAAWWVSAFVCVSARLSVCASVVCRHGSTNMKTHPSLCLGVYSLAGVGLTVVPCTVCFLCMCSLSSILRPVSLSKLETCFPF